MTRATFPLLLVFMLGCQGFVSDPGQPAGPHSTRDPGSDGPRVISACVDQELVGVRDIARLSRAEYSATLADLLSREAFDRLSGAIAQIPIDRVGSAPDRLAQDIGASHVRGYAAVAEAAGTYFENEHAARAELLGCDPLDAGCIESFVESFGEAVYRRPLDVMEVASYVSLYGLGADDAEGVGLVVARMLQAPDFVLRVEVRGEDARSGETQLTGRELANRLAYDLWGAPPDAELIAAADSGALLTGETLSAQVDRMLAGPRAQETFLHFARQWLQLDREYDVDNVPNHIRDGASTSGLTQASQEELDQLLTFIAFDRQGTYRDLMTTPISFVHSDALAEIYGVTPGTPDDPMVMLDDSRRHGLLTRVGMLAADNGHANLIHRGKFVRTQLLCDALPPPPSDLPEDATQEPELDPSLTTRQRYEAKTAGAECQACHTAINPLGFALEDYDGLGRYRTEEPIFDESDELVGTLPIDANAEPGLAEGGSVEGGAELSAALGGAQQAIECAAVQYVEFSLRRALVAEDACLVDELATRLDEPGGFVAAIRAYVLRPEYRLRRYSLTPTAEN